MVWGTQTTSISGRHQGPLACTLWQREMRRRMPKSGRYSQPSWQRSMMQFGRKSRRRRCEGIEIEIVTGTGTGIGGTEIMTGMGRSMACHRRGRGHPRQAIHGDLLHQECHCLQECHHHQVECHHHQAECHHHQECRHRESHLAPCRQEWHPHMGALQANGEACLLVCLHQVCHQVVLQVCRQVHLLRACIQLFRLLQACLQQVDLQVFTVQVVLLLACLQQAGHLQACLQLADLL
mmetsp:Transcript_73444/g.137247  ORF Transcript_73444/g.137247 Transcript_73444/m.137247 type:complete len:236 (-) Transcript_73444:112-819(-)